MPGSSLAFDEGIVRAELPLSRHSGGVVDAVVGKGALHVLSTGGMSPCWKLLSHQGEWKFMEISRVLKNVEDELFVNFWCS